MSDNKFYIIDGSGFLFRAYYAFPELHDKDGHNINVVFGFFRMIFKLLQDQPKYFVITWDSPVKTVRHDMFAEYKANRPKQPDDFRNQIKLVKKLVTELNFPNLQIPGYEADDIIATLTWRTKKIDKTIMDYIISSDKDLKQLINGQVVTLDPMKNKLTDSNIFFEEMGFEPKHMLDYLSLLGDASDNVPGVRGVGKVGASKLVTQYKDLDTIYKNIEEIKGATQNKLIEGKESAYLSKKLIELINVPGMEELVLTDFEPHLDFEHFEKVFVGEYGFKSFHKHLQDLQRIYKSKHQQSLF